MEILMKLEMTETSNGEEICSNIYSFPSDTAAGVVGEPLVVYYCTKGIQNMNMEAMNFNSKWL